MIDANFFLSECLNKNIKCFTGTPCSYLRPFINAAINHKEARFVSAVNEGDAVAIAAGSWLGGEMSLVMFQNSGLGNAVNPLTSLISAFKIPILGIVTLRGDPTTDPDEPQHMLMGKITAKLLDLLEIDWDYFPETPDQVSQHLEKVYQEKLKKGRPFFYIMRKDQILNCNLENQKTLLPDANKTLIVKDQQIKLAYPSRTESLKCILEVLKPKCNYHFIATTGVTGRELFELGDTSNFFYMVGSMGCAPSLGLGLALTSKDKAVCVIDGDGALMMRMGNMTSIGIYQPSNLVHILLDNGAHDSTGGQKTGSEYIDFALLAKACGYKHIYLTESLVGLSEFLKRVDLGEGPYFFHVKIKTGHPKSLGRPTIRPEEVAIRFQASFRGNDV